MCRYFEEVYRMMQKKWIVGVLAICVLFLSAMDLKGESKGIESGQRYDELVIRNVVVIDGKGTPPRGPVDIILKGNTIHLVQSADLRPEAYQENLHVLDGSGLYALPGLINIHAHIHDNRGGVPIPFEYLYKLWLSCGITTARDVGSNYDKTIQERQKSQEGSVVAPRIFLYMTAWGRNPEEMKQSVREIKRLGGDGVKIFGMDQDIMEAALTQAHELGFRVATTWELRKRMPGMMRLWVSLRSNTGMVFRMQLSRVLKILPMNTTTAMRAIGSGMLEDSGEKPIPIS